MTDGFDRVLRHIRSLATSEAEGGRLFKRLMNTYFGRDAIYRKRFSNVWLWAEWAERRRDLPALELGIDVVAKECGGGFCAIQCKCYAKDTRISKAEIESSIAASGREPYIARILVDTRDDWGPNALKTIQEVRVPGTVVRFGDLASPPFDWPDLVHDGPEALTYRNQQYDLPRHLLAAFGDVVVGDRAFSQI